MYKIFMFRIIFLCILFAFGSGEEQEEGEKKRFPIWPFEFAWSFAGDLANKGYNCTLIDEPEQSINQYWYDNHLCYLSAPDIRDPGLRWSIKGPIEGMKCTRVWEPADSHDWHDNYLCVPEDSPFNFKYSFDGCIRNIDCISVNEPGDLNTWWDNYLCHTRTGYYNESYKHFCFGYTAAAVVRVMRCSLCLVLSAALILYALFLP